MKILYLLDSLNRGGSEVLILDICRNAKAKGLDAAFAALGGGDLEADFRESGSDFIRLQRRMPVDFPVIIALRKIIRKRKIEIIHANQAVEAIHAYFAVFGTQTKIVLSHHGFIQDKKNLFALKFLIPRVAANVVVSRALLRWYETETKLNFPANVKIVDNGADEKRLAGKGENFRKELGLTEEALLFGMIGNFYRDPRKDQMTVCKALPKVFAEIKEARCVFAGKTESGAEEKRKDCEKFCRENNISEKVHFLGARADVPDILNALDLFVFSSLHEGLPIAAVEAMLAKVPLIMSDIEPLLEVSENGKYAEIFPVQNAEILSQKITGLLRDKTRRENLAERASEFARENYSIEAHIERLKTLYKSLIR